MTDMDSNSDSAGLESRVTIIGVRSFFGAQFRSANRVVKTEVLRTSRQQVRRWSAPWRRISPSAGESGVLPAGYSTMDSRTGIGAVGKLPFVRAGVCAFANDG